MLTRTNKSLRIVVLPVLWPPQMYMRNGLSAMSVLQVMGLRSALMLALAKSETDSHYGGYFGVFLAYFGPASQRTDLH